MENQVQTVSAVPSTLEKARHGLVNGVKKTGEVIRTYAQAMCATFNLVDSSGTIVTPWYELTGKAKAGVTAEYERFKAEMDQAGFDKATVYVYWGRVKEASGKVKTENRVSGSATVDEKTRDELKTIINRIFKAEENGQECSASSFKGALMEVFQALGGEIDKLG